MNVEIKDGTLKARHGRYVVYDVDYLLKNLSREIYLLESSKRCPKQVTDKELKEIASNRQVTGADVILKELKEMVGKC